MESDSDLNQLLQNLTEIGIDLNEPEPSVHVAAQVIWNWSTVLKTIVLSLIVAGTILGNSLVLLAMATNKNRNLRSSTHYFIANLAAADLFVGILAMPFLATLTITGNWYFGQTLCTLWEYTHFWLCSASILSVCAICVDRYVGVGYPLKHYRLMNKRRVVLMSCGVWAMALFLGAFPLTAWPEPPSPNKYVCKINQQLGHVLIASVGILYIPATIMLVLYGMIYYITCKHFENMGKGFLATGQKGGGGGFRLHIGDYSNSSSSGTSMKTSIDSFSSNGDLTGVGKTDVKASNANGVAPAGVNGGRKSIVLQQAEARRELNQLVLTRNRQVRVAKKLAIVVVAFICSYVPFFTVFLIGALDPSAISTEVFLFFGWIRYFNSCLNPIIYAATLPAFAKSFKNILLCKFMR